MSDRIKGYIVTLAEDYRDDDAKPIQAAILMTKGVADVTPLVVDHVDFMARSRVRRELREKLYKVIEEG